MNSFGSQNQWFWEAKLVVLAAKISGGVGGQN
jgi:hypothetical protein